jgi:hypothetical protein
MSAIAQKYNVKGPERIEVECFNMTVRRDEDTQIKTKRLSGNTSVYAKSFDLVFYRTPVPGTKRMVRQESSVTL